jgi:hypothetical protein
MADSPITGGVMLEVRVFFTSPYCRTRHHLPSPRASLRIVVCKGGMIFYVAFFFAVCGLVVLEAARAVAPPRAARERGKRQRALPWGVGQCLVHTTARPNPRGPLP